MATSTFAPTTPGWHVTLIEGVTYLTGEFDLDGPQTFHADELRLLTPVKLTKPIVATEPQTTVTMEDGSVRTGWAIDSTYGHSTLSLVDGTRISGKHRTTVTPRYKVYTFEVAGRQRVKVRATYKNGLSYAVPSRVLRHDGKECVIDQQFDITNRLSFDLNKVRSLNLSFQQRVPPTRSRFQDTSFGSEVKEMGHTAEDIIGEVAAPINLGPVERLPAQSVMTCTPLEANVLAVTDSYTDVDMNHGTTIKATLEFKGTRTVFPATVHIEDPETTTVRARFTTHLQLPGSIFEAAMGDTTALSVKNVERSEGEVKGTLISNVNRPLHVRATASSITHTFFMTPRSTVELTIPFPAYRRDGGITKPGPPSVKVLKVAALPLPEEPPVVKTPVFTGAETHVALS